MTDSEAEQQLESLLASPEDECLEFKTASQKFDLDSLGKYFSALSNEANLRNRACAWIVFGVDDSRKVVGTQYRLDTKKLHHLKQEIAQHTTGQISFTEIKPLQTNEGRVILFQVPAAPRGIPVSWQGHYYAREGDSMAGLNIQKIETIRGQSQIQNDWSAKICEGATIGDLDTDALQQARRNYKEKFAAKHHEIDSWDDITFLNKAKLTIQGKITHAALLLLGKSESSHFLLPYIGQISWFLKSEKNESKDYEHFYCPLLLASEKVYAKIRNLTYRYIIDATLFPSEIMMYDPFVIREALHNCIAHQDYELHGRITVVEQPDALLFTNVGKFMPESVEKVIEMNAPPTRYRNQFLATAMLNLGLIDTEGGGIRKMFVKQRKRFFPLPEYMLSDDHVQVKVFGKVLNENYTRLLIHDPTLDLRTVMLLDAVQKQKELSDANIRLLKSRRMIEGRKPNYFISAVVAQVTAQKAAYTKNRAFDKQYYHDLIINFLKQHGEASRHDIDELLLEKLPQFLSVKQKKIKINHLLSELSKKQHIQNIGTYRFSKWVIVSHL
jgi:ATP-dependent DNA helicase RecG